MIYEEAVKALLAEVDGMLMWMCQKVTIDEPEVIARRISDVNVYLSRSAYIQTQAQYMKDCQEEELRPSIDPALKETEKRRIYASAVKDTTLLINRAEKVNHGLVQQGNNLRKQLSYIMEVSPRKL